MQQYVHRHQAATTRGDIDVANPPRWTFGRPARTLISTLLWVLSALIFVGAALALAALLQRAGMHPKHAELVLGLTYFPLYLIVRKAWITARHKLLATEFDAFLKSQNIAA